MKNYQGAKHGVSGVALLNMEIYVFHIEIFMIYIEIFMIYIEIFMDFKINILSETSKPPLDIFSHILTYMLHTWLQFTLNMEKSSEHSLSKFHFHKLKLTCSIDRLYKGTIAFYFHTNAKI